MKKSGSSLVILLRSNLVISKSKAWTFRLKCGGFYTIRRGSIGNPLMFMARKQSFEWGLVEGDEHVIHTAKKPENEIPSRINIPDFAHLLPPEIRSFTKTIQDDEHLSFLQGGGHGGSHPHMVHEFVTALAEDREPWPNAVKSANWTCVGICAHESAMKGGERVRLPEFTIESKG